MSESIDMEFRIGIPVVFRDPDPAGLRRVSRSDSTDMEFFIRIPVALWFPRFPPCTDWLRWGRTGDLKVEGLVLGGRAVLTLDILVVELAAEGGDTLTALEWTDALFRADADAVGVVDMRVGGWRGEMDVRLMVDVDVVDAVDVVDLKEEGFWVILLLFPSCDILQS